MISCYNTRKGIIYQPRMHKNQTILLVLLFVFGHVAHAVSQSEIQPSIILDNNVSGSNKTYTARDNVTLKPGFRYTASGTNTFNATIDPRLLFPPTLGTYMTPQGLLTSQPIGNAIVGSLPSTTDISPTGAAIYQIPIDVPKGLNGMEPNLSIVYNSQAGLGLLGVKFDISGLSVITRGNKTVYYDEYNDNIKIDTTDALFLDGQRLMLVSSSGELTNGAIYATEVENYARVLYTGSGFILTTVDGKTLEYGISDDAKLKNWSNQPDDRVLAWKLNKVTDAYGNTITYTYRNLGRYIQQINYGNNSIKISFNYTSLNRMRLNYVNSFGIANNLLLSSIDTQMFNGENKKTYSFNYLDNNQGLTRRLQSISLTASDGSKVGATSFGWGEDSSILTNPIKVKNNTDPNLGINQGSVYMGDVNNDGYADLIEMWPGPQNSDPASLGHIKIYLFQSSENKYSENSINTFFNNVHLKSKLVIADINNDGKNEVILVDPRNIYVYTYNNLALSLSQTISVSQNTDAGNSYYSQNFQVFVDDFTRDGINDLIITYEGRIYCNVFLDELNNPKYNERNDIKNNLRQLYDRCINEGNFGDAGYLVYNGTLSGLNSVPYRNFVPTVASQYNFNQQVGDFNADGIFDIMKMDNNSNTYYKPNNNESLSTILVSNNQLWGQVTNNNRRMYTADFNGDGRSDILIQNNEEGGYTFKIAYSNGLNNSPTMVDLPDFNPCNDGSNSGESDYVIPYDYNGDGLIDVVIVDEDNIYQSLSNAHTKHIKFYFYRNVDGYSFELDFFKNIAIQVNERKPELFSPILTDINGDGIPDLLYSLSSGYYVFTKPDADRRFVVESITNGMQQREFFSYKNFSNYNLTHTTDAIRNLKVPLLVVDTYTQADGSYNIYTFQDPKIHTQGKGFLGFMNIMVTNSTQNIRSLTSYEVVNNNYFNVGLKSQVIKDMGNNAEISRISQTNDVIVVDAQRKRYIPITNVVVNQDYLKGLIQTTTNDYSNYPTSTKKNVTMGGLTSITETIFTGPPNKIPYLPQQIKSSNVLDGDTITRTIDYTYQFDPINSYKIIGMTETQDSGDENQLVTQYANYDTKGNYQMISVTANGSTRTSSITYTPSGRFVASKTNVMGEQTVYQWDEAKGLLLNETALGKTTSYSYDSFGKLKDTFYPDGNRATKVVQWAGNDAPYSDAKYYTYSQLSGQAPIITWYDDLAREICTETIGLNNKKIAVYTEYYTSGINNGKVFRISEPYFSDNNGNVTQWAKTYNYDNFGRVTQISTPIGTYTTTYNGLTTTTHTPEGSTTTVQNSAGFTTSVTQNGKTVSYTYYPSGLVKLATPEGGEGVTTEYNIQGKRIKMIDPNVGEIITRYNGFGEVVEEKQKVHTNDFISTLYQYQPTTGKLLSVQRADEITQYQYDNQNRISSVEIAGKHKICYQYDELSRVINTREEVDNKVFNTAVEYDKIGRVAKEVYPTGYTINNIYDTYSNLVEIKDEIGRQIWQVVAENAKGQLLQAAKGGRAITYSYDNRGMLTSAISGNSIHMEYGYNNNLNLTYRKDVLTNQREDFQYDQLNRLTQWEIYNTAGYTPNSITYNNEGNIQTKTDIGDINMLYGANGRPNAIASITPPPASVPLADLNITYTNFKKVASLSEGNKYYSISYGVNEQRCKSAYYHNGQLHATRYYIGNYEEEIDQFGNIKQIHYLSGAVYIKEIAISGQQQQQLYYTYTDHLGSLIAITNENGNVVERYAYDPWGARRNPDNWAQTDSRTTWLLNRGFTGHEHIDAFGIINMNGRVYDPLTAQFFSPDPYIQSPENWLSYNRYAYCWSNPLVYTDPDGEIVWFIYAGAAIVGGTLNLISNWNKVDNVWSALGYFGSGALGGAISVANPLLGGSITSGGNFITDIASGKVPEFNNVGDVLLYTGGLALDGFGAAGVGQIGRHIGVKLASSYLTTTTATGTFAKVGEATATEAFQVAGMEFSVVSTKVGSAPVQMALQGVKGGTQAAAKTSTKLPTQIHHFATNKNKIFTPQMSQIADEFGLGLNGAWNKQALPHLGRHPNAYHNFVLDGMQKARAGAGGSQAEFLNLFNQYVKQPVIQNPGLLRKSGW
jgi:RHS repeat-associated protein